MPGLIDVCQNIPCCKCIQNNCSIALSNRGSTILFVDGEEAIRNGAHCDCIMVLKRSNFIEIYSIELKNVQVTGPNVARGAFNPNTMRQKCDNCLRWALNVVSRFQSVHPGQQNIITYCIIVIPITAYNMIATLIRRQRPRQRFRPRNSNAGRVLQCNSTITGQALLQF